ncbi:hypothetical protein RI845_07370 [Thalassotalea nanhaiensis]|uniref:Transposase n=1 Tax=Thalassotalea nanhaiensis TaxID=3065648 RepID=A0ABY9TMB6_9GAMM|nr:hypothetical protein RI845_07370 [Colwelliaceae bacterium SQ345]
MGRWQEKIKNIHRPTLQNLLNPTELSSVGFVGTSGGHLQIKITDNEQTPKTDFTVEPAVDKLVLSVDDQGLPLHHCRGEPNGICYGDSEWVRYRLQRVAKHKRPMLAHEYSKLYLANFDEESNEIRKENKARKAANSWLREATAHPPSA